MDDAKSQASSKAQKRSNSEELVDKNLINANEDGTRLILAPSSISKEEFEEIAVSVTDNQYDAITYPATMNQILRIQAGPGSGKTFTLVSRIAWLLEKGMRPDEILVLSMANRSVDSLIDSLSNLIGREQALQVDISTFHSFCGVFLDQYGSVMETDHVRQQIFDERSWNNMISIFSGKSIRFRDQSIDGSISRHKFNNVIASIMSGGASIHDAAVRHGINPSYVEELIIYLRRNGIVRYDAIIHDAVSLINKSASEYAKSASRERSQELIPRLATYKAVVIDEFQDIYPSLISVVQSIVQYPSYGVENKSKHLTVAGDPNQCIYEFLGTFPEDMDHLDRKLPHMEIVDRSLAESFRCSQPILDACMEVSLTGQNLQLRSIRESAAKVKPILFKTSNVCEEQDWVADEIVRILCQSGGLIHMKDIAILTRSNESAISMQHVLKSRLGIASQKLSQGNLWVKSKLHIYKEILNVIVGGFGSSLSLMAVLQILDRKFGSQKRISSIFNLSLESGSSDDPAFLETFLMEALSSANYSTSSLVQLYRKNPQTLEHLAAFLNQVQYERKRLNDLYLEWPLAYDPVELASCLARIKEIPGVKHYFDQDRTNDDNSQALDILESFENSLHHSFENYARKTDVQTMSFMEYFLQSYDDDTNSTSEDTIQVSTIHSAKGLEFPIVFILGHTKYSTCWDSIVETVLREQSDGQSTCSIAVNALSKHSATTMHSDIEGAANEKKLFARPDAARRLFYVALSRARNLVYVGTSKPYSEFTTSANAKFAAALPEFRSGTQVSLGESQAVPSARISETCLIASSRDSTLLHQQQPSSNREVGAKSLEGTENIDSKRGPKQGQATFQLLKSLSLDLDRKVPTSRNLNAGFEIYQKFRGGAGFRSDSASKIAHNTVTSRYAMRKYSQSALQRILTNTSYSVARCIFP